MTIPWPTEPDRSDTYAASPWSDPNGKQWWWEDAKSRWNPYPPAGGGGGGAVDSVNGMTGAVTVTKSTVGLSNADNTSDVNKPVSTATQTALNLKQTALVSGTNIKTINGASVLGSGNITISGGDVAGETFAAASKAAPVDADALPLVDSAASNTLKKLTWASLKTTLASVFSRLGSTNTFTGINTFSGSVYAADISAASLATSGTVAATGAITGSNVSGTNTGDQTTITGNAGSATVLQTARTINGVSFNGSANIVIPSASTIMVTVDGTIVTGVKGGVLRAPSALTITGWTVIQEGGSSPTCAWDVWVETAAIPDVADTVCNTAGGGVKPAGSGAINNSANVNNWITAIAAGDLIKFNLDSVTGGPTKITLHLHVTK